MTFPLRAELNGPTLAGWQLRDLIALVRQRYPQWDGCDHPGFVADEIAPKRATIEKAQALLNAAEVEGLIVGFRYDELLRRLERLGKDNSLLWNRVPRQGDLAVLYHPRLDKPAFALQLQRLLYGSGPTPQRLDAFAAYAFAHNLPNKWAFATYFLFITHPDVELFVKPQVAQWLLRFLGRAELYTRYPAAEVYALLRYAAHDLGDALRPYGAHDMVDVQSFLWVCARESRARTGRLDTRAQVELDVPLPLDEAPAYAALYEPAGEYAAPDAAAADATEAAAAQPDYPLEAVAAATGYERADLARWRQAIARKGQAIFYGPPGTGKTFLAQQMARHLVGGGDGFVDVVQFHPAYQYEDFIEGIRPMTRADGGLRYEMVPGRFLQFCAAARRREGPCVLVIDEINRAHLSRVFGELMYLLEYRDEEVVLASGNRFRIPGNVRILGTMNTADRSIALVDHALRRRFAFIALAPDYDVLRHFHTRQETGYDVEPLIAVLKRLNEAIGDPHYAVGITYFLRPDLDEQLAAVWQMEIVPYLEEYFFDRPDQVTPFRWEALARQLA